VARCRIHPIARPDRQYSTSENLTLRFSRRRVFAALGCNRLLNDLY
jgi:hypothetical protein